jgi:phosphopantothenoylcysteine decarboxylase / phosphopantothenate---cysteine ligase
VQVTLKNGKPNSNPLDIEHTNNTSDCHPSKDIKGTLGQELSGKRIVVCVTASIACYKAIDLIRTFIRHGAEVFVVISKTVEKFMSKDYFLWASGNLVISELSGELEHVRIANYDSSDLIVVYPSTANTIGKFANGIDDTPVTSVLSIAIGAGIPIIIAPAMHEAMYYNPIIKSNIQKLESFGIMFSKPLLEEDKAKVAPADLVYSQSLEFIKSFNDKVDSLQQHTDRRWDYFCKNPTDILSGLEEKKLLSYFRKKKILISAGSTIEYIDPIRIISNTSSGKMGLSLIKQALNFESDVTIIKGMTQFDEEFRKLSKRSNPPLLIETKTTNQMAEALTCEMEKRNYDIVILAAAVADFKPSFTSDKKIPTGHDSIDLKLVPTIKIVDTVKHIQKHTFLVAFKAEYSVSYDMLLEKSWKKLVQSGADLIIANDVGSAEPIIGSDSNKILALDRERNFYDFPLQDKKDVANNILKLIYLKHIKKN